MPVIEAIRRRISRIPPPLPPQVELFDETFLKRLEYLYIVSRKIFAGRQRAERRTRKTGSGIEFADHRDYVPGDDLRYLDWNVYGRLDRLLLRLFEEEEDLHIYIIVDTSVSMGFGEPMKLHYAMQLAAAISYVGLASLDRVSLVGVNDKIVERLPPARGKGRIFKVFEFLRGLELGGETDLETACKTFVAQNKRKGIVVLLSDLYDPAGFEKGINTLRFGRFETGVVQIFDHSEIHPDLHGDLSLVDCETGEAREVTITPRVLARYAEEHRKYRETIEQFCRDKQVAYFPADTAVPFDELVLKVLRRGGAPSVSLAGLTLAQYAALLGGAGALVVLFYILKLRRRRMAVPFGKLWERVLMERQATSLLQRLRRILSLFLQLLLLWLLVTALADPREEEETRRGRDFVVLIDGSASMRARDVDRGDGRIGEARAAARQMIGKLGPRDRMMLVQMDARIVPLTPMVSDRLILEEGLSKVRATDTAADFARALRLAEDVLSRDRESHVVVVSDGVLGEPRDGLGRVQLSKADIHWVKVGRGGRNVALTSFSVRRYPVDRGSCEIFAEVANTGERDEEVELTLVGDGHDLLVRRARVAKGKSINISLPGQTAATQSLEAHVALVGGACTSDDDCPDRGGRCSGDRRCIFPDDQPADDRAYGLLPERRPIRILAVSPGNLYLAAALLLDEYMTVTEMSPESYETWLREGGNAAAQQPFDTIIFDGVAPTPPPAGDLLYLGVEGTDPPLEVADAVTGSLWFDSTRSKRGHPILRYVSFGDFEVYQASRVTPEPEDQVIAKSEAGLPLVVVREEEERTTTMLTFALRHSDLPLRMAWPVMLMNVLSWYVEQDSGFVSSYATGEPVHVRLSGEADEAQVCGPEGCETVAVHEGEAVFVPFRSGLYSVSAGDGHAMVAVNLRAPGESAILPAEELSLPGQAPTAMPEMRAGVGGEIWLWLVIVAMLIVAVEWLTYHRRVTV